MLDTPNYTGWTPDVVKDLLVEAAWLAVMSSGPGPSGFKAAPEFMMATTEDLDDTMPVDEEEANRRHRRRLPPAKVSYLDRAMLWPAAYLKEQPGAARMLQLWLRCKVSKRRFDKELKARQLSRATAYRKRDLALSLISIGLDRDGVVIWGE